MQGTIVMLMALSGLGCHNKCYDVAYGPPAYGCVGGGCYANVYPTGWASPQSFAGCYAGGYSGCYSTGYGCFGGGCFGGGYGSCYSACYGGGYRRHGCGLLAGLFGCCRWKNSDYYAFDTSYGGPMDSGISYNPPIFGYALQYNYGGDSGAQVGPGASGTPSEAAPVPPNPVPPGGPTSTTPPPPAAVPPATTTPAPPPPPAAVPAVPSPRT